jgi:hypothetical protein
VLPEASAFTTKLATGKTVRLDFEGATKDKYNRTLGLCLSPGQHAPGVAIYDTYNEHLTAATGAVMTDASAVVT